MPSVFTLEGAKFGSAALGEDTPFMAWLRNQNPVVMGITVLGLSLGVGLLVSSVAIYGLQRFKGER